MALVVQTLSDRIFDLIREQIIWGELEPGETIRQDAIASLFGTSKIPVREALSRLEGLGLVCSKANKGFTAAPLGPRAAQEFFSLRRLIEPTTIAAAAASATPKSRDGLLQAYEGLKDAPDIRSQILAYRASIHAMLNEPGTTVSASIVSQLLDGCQRLFALQAAKADLDIEGLGYVIDGWMSNNGDAIVTRHRRHLENQLLAASAIKIILDPQPELYSAARA
jgi:DNA-binding GntR family transcriptional regulator